MKISLKAARVNAGLTQEKVAKYMHKDKATIVSWEKGKTKIDKANFLVLCQLYKMPQCNIFLP